MKIYIKNMVCNRCKTAVTKVLEKMNLKCTDIKLGEVEIEENLTNGQIENLSHSLSELGFEILNDKQAQLIEKIKSTIIELIHSSGKISKKINHSDYISQAVGKDYTYLSSLFSVNQGITIERYFINQKIERVKELITYGENSLTEIAFATDYSSSQHLSRQFKEVTGMTPSEFRNNKDRTRKTLDEI